MKENVSGCFFLNTVYIQEPYEKSINIGTMRSY